MPALLGIFLELFLLVVVAWFCFWLIDHLNPPPDFPPVIFFLKVVVVIIFLAVALGMFGVFGTAFHPVLFQHT